MGRPVVAVIGAGAIGQFYGARLVRGGAEVRFLLRRDFAAVSRCGLVVRQTATTQIEGSAHEAELRFAPDRFRACRTPAECAAGAPVDWVLLALKTTAFADPAGLADTAALLRPLLAATTRVVVMCNGLGVEEALARRLGAERLLGMLCFVCVNRRDDGVIEHLGHGRVGVGSLTGDRAAGEALTGLCSLGGIQCDHFPSLLEARWRKLVWNVPFNGLCVVHDCGTDTVLADPGLRRRARVLMEEVVTAGNAELVARGEPGRIEPAWIDEQFRRTALMADYLPSTLIDVRAGRDIELDAMFREPLARAQGCGIPVPELAALTSELAHRAARTARTARPEA